MKRQSPDKRIEGLGGLTLADFWSWAYSDLLTNVNRSRFAEFLVASALGLLDAPRIEWDAVDLRYHGKAIEVKSAAYLQSWPHAVPSIIRFDIARKLAWDAATNTYAQERGRPADGYVFCLFAEQDRARADVLNLDAWEFYVLPTERIDREFGEQKSAGLSRIRALCPPVAYAELAEQIALVLGGD
jgi:hypothetical protein